MISDRREERKVSQMISDRRDESKVSQIMPDGRDGEIDDLGGQTENDRVSVFISAGV